MTPAPRFSPSDIDRIKKSVDMAGIIGSYIPLEKSGVEYKGRCPFHNEATPSFYVIPHKAMFHCFGCNESGDIIKFLQKAERLDFTAALDRLRGMPTADPRRFTSASAAAAQIKDDAEKTRRNIENARRIWDESLSPSGTLVEKYLTARRLGGVMIPATLRFHPQLWCQETRGHIPAMVGAVTDARQRIIAVHRTYLLPDGSGKARLKEAKKILGPYSGSHVCLALPTGGILAVAEGIETSLSVMRAKPNLAVWAAMSLSNLHAPIPKSISELILCADGDNKDPIAAEKVLQKAAQIHRERGHRVRIARPDPGKDFNDMIAS